MTDEHLEIDEQQFLLHFGQHASQLMWFLGAGAPPEPVKPSETVRIG